MKLSSKKAIETHDLLASWTAEPQDQMPAIDAFLGDIYSGLQVSSFSDDDRAYANDHLLILSGLYGGLKALDSVHPYRLEMGYRLPKKPYDNLYSYWDDSIAQLIHPSCDILNLSAVEYTKAVLPHLPNETRVITPKFMTVSQKTGKPEFVTVHAKIARGAFAHWILKNRIEDHDQLPKFDDLGYSYDHGASTPDEPIFVCETFAGLGLSVRLT